MVVCGTTEIDAQIVGYVRQERFYTLYKVSQSIFRPLKVLDFAVPVASSLYLRIGIAFFGSAFDTAHHSSA